MQVIKTDIPDVLLIEPKVFGDERGFFYESFNNKTFLEKTSHYVPNSMVLDIYVQVTFSENDSFTPFL